MMQMRMMIPTMRMIRCFTKSPKSHQSYFSWKAKGKREEKKRTIFMSFHHICLRTLLAPRLNPCAETARLSGYSWKRWNRGQHFGDFLVFELAFTAASAFVPIQGSGSRQ